MPNLQLTLFITGRTTRSEQAIANLHRMLDEVAVDGYVLKVCDVLEEPQAAEDAKIVATPALVRTLPPSPIRFIGDFSDIAKLQPFIDLLVP